MYSILHGLVAVLGKQNLSNKAHASVIFPGAETFPLAVGGEM